MNPIDDKRKSMEIFELIKNALNEFPNLGNKIWGTNKLTNNKIRGGYH